MMFEVSKSKKKLSNIAFRNFVQISFCLIFHGHDCTITMSRKNNSLSMMNKVSAAMPFQADQETGLCSQTRKQPFSFMWSSSKAAKRPFITYIT